MKINSETILESLKKVIEPDLGKDIVSLGLVADVKVLEDKVSLSVQMKNAAMHARKRMQEACAFAIERSIGKDYTIEVNVQAMKKAEASQSVLPNIKNTIAVVSGKGGVGKSTISSNLAIALSKKGLKVGLLDCDLYGPSVPLMLGVPHHQPQADSQDRIIPIEAHGLKLMSMGFLLGDDSPVIVRGPLANRYTQQFLQQVAWGELDILVLDLPPGTGDIQLTLVQTVSLDGAIIVTTPQEVAIIDARKASSMFAKVNVPILGIIENMSYFECDHGMRYHLFGEGGAQRECDRIKVPLLGKIPLEPIIGKRCDGGEPTALLSPSESKASAAFHDAAQALLDHVSI